MSKLLLLCLMLLVWGQTMAQPTRLPIIKKADSLITAKPALQPKLQQRANSTASTNNQTSYLAATALQDASTQAYWPDRVFVKLKDQSEVQLQTFKTKAARPKVAGNKISGTFQRYEASSVSALPVSAKLASTRKLYEVVVEKPEAVNDLLSELNAMPDVAYAERVPYYVTSAVPNDPYFTNNSQYALNLTKAAQAFGIHTGTNKTLLAIIDDAVLVSHPDLAANIDLEKSYDVANNDNDPRPPFTGLNAAGAQVFSHGTHCAGIAGAVTNNGIGISAVSHNNIRIMGVKCTTDEAVNTRAVERAYEGVVYAINQGARVLSLSWGGIGSSTTYQNLFNEATANGIVVVAAAGNEAVETKTYPAAYNHVIAVSSSDSKDLASSFTNYGTWVDITAPGSAIMSTVAGGAAGSYTTYSGTSMATPLVAGMVAYMLSENPNLTPQAVLEILKSSADPIDHIIGQNKKYLGKLGAGRINVLKAIQTIQGLTNKVAPAAIANLTASNVTATSLKLSWTSPTVNSTEKATLYDVRYAFEPITAANFGTANRTTSSVAPAAPGTQQELLVKDLLPGTTYYLAVMARSFYGDGTLSNIISAKTLAAPRLQFDKSAITLSLNRETGKTGTQQLAIGNAGSEPLQYTATVIPASGSNILAHDKETSGSEGSVGFGGASFYTAVKFVAGPRGFLLTHVQNVVGNTTTVTSAAIGIRIFKGGTSPGNATLLTTQTASGPVVAGGSLQSFTLQEPQQFQPGEVFWVDFKMPQGLDYPQGYDKIGEKPATFFISGDGKNYNDAQLLAAFLATAAFKVRALSASGFLLSPASGTVAAAQQQPLTLAIDTDGQVNGTYQAYIQIVSNDPIEPVVNRPLTVTLTGGEPEIFLEHKALDFGSLYAHASVTKQFTVQNTGIADLVLNTATFAGGAFSAADFTLSPAAPATIKPGSQQVFSVTFKPSAVGNMAATLTLTSNVPATPTAVINLSATATTPPIAVTPATLSVILDEEDKATAITKAVTISNTGDKRFDYTLQVQQEVSQTLKYDADQAPDSFTGLNSTTATIHTAMKFDVTSPTFSLLQVQNYYRTEAAINRNITLKVYKGGTNPANGTLLAEQIFSSEASANQGAFITIPLQQPLQFVKNDVFWVVFTFTGVPYPQGYTGGGTSTNRSFHSANGTSWTAYNTNTFKIRALGAPTWLTTTPVKGTIAAGEEANFEAQLQAGELTAGQYKAKVLVKTDKADYPELVVDVNLTVRGLLVADFTTAYTTVLTGSSITFRNTSTSADAYEWEFEGAETTTSTEASPTVTYKIPGTYKVSLVAKKANTGNSKQLVKEEYISVADYHCEKLNTPFIGSIETYKSGDDYITGNSTRAHLAKANLFTYNRAGYSYLMGTSIRFGYVAPAAGATATLQVAVWSVSGGIPDKIIASKNINLKDIAADIAAQRTTEVPFDAAVPVPDHFMVGVVLNQGTDNQVAIATHSTTQQPAEGVQGWEQQKDGSWNTLLAGWGTDLAMFIQPTLSRRLNPFAASLTLAAPLVKPEVCVGTEMVFSAAQTTGATRLEWVHAGADEARTTDDQLYLTYHTPGTYTVTLLAFDACNARTSISKTITVTALPVATVIVSGATTLCEGSSLTLTAPTGVSYRWSTSETTQAITVAAAGNFTVTVKNAGGCETTSEAVAVTIQPSPPKPVISQTDDELTSSAATGNQWFLNGTAIPGATAQTFTMTERGNYTVQVTTGSCASAMSEVLTPAILTALPEPAAGLKALEVYPNPTAGAFSISFNLETRTDVHIRAINSTGQVVLEEILTDFNGIYEKKLDLKHAASGIYMLQVQYADKVETRKIVLKR
ncbi:S8 family serine peptidase [Pontibacter sp. 13R65]|uniref:S8 family serine peptidase n=1 Tax=Pontibacter sp. 13R65 TaxID=3127458 RepID=UPI00301C4F77